MRPRGNNFMSIRKGIIKQASQLVLFLADWLFPKECVGCALEGAWLCADCQKRLSWQPYQACLVCGAETDGKICQQHNWALDRVLAAADYDDLLIKNLVKICKYHFSREAGEEMTKLLCGFWREHNFSLNSETIIVPAPLSRQRLNWRGFNQSAILARALAEDLKLTYDEKNLVKIKQTKPQVALSEHERLSNLRNCFIWKGEKLSDKTVVIIDDVATTGATLNECAKALKQAGAKKVWGVVLAK